MTSGMQKAMGCNPALCEGAACRRKYLGLPPWTESRADVQLSFGWVAGVNGPRARDRGPGGWAGCRRGGATPHQVEVEERDRLLFLSRARAEYEN